MKCLMQNASQHATFRVRIVDTHLAPLRPKCAFPAGGVLALPRTLSAAFLLGRNFVRPACWL